MKKYAVIETGGKQLRVSENQEIFVEKLDCKEGDNYTFDKVLLVGGETLKIGKPLIKGAKVTAKVLKNGRGPKLIVFKYKAKNNDAKKQGHRQPYTKLQIKKITL